MPTALQEPNQALLDLPGCEFTPTQLILPSDLSYDHWERIGRQLQLAGMAIQWWIGDWLVYGEHKWREKYAQAVLVTGRSEQTLMNYAFVARAISPSRRREQVDFSTHAEVAGLSEAEQERLLDKAAKEGSTKRQLRREAEKVRRAQRPKPPDDQVVLSNEAREFLDDYMNEIGQWTGKIPKLAASEHEAIERMILQQGACALWLRNRTITADYKAIVELFSFEEGTPGMERAGKSDIAAWLERCGYYMSDSDLNDRLDLMVEKHMLDIHSVEESRQDGRRGVMLDLYALNENYEAELETRR